ncbi:hypothetical protein [Paracoccus pacificus]|uniref:Uncharacterized protein n=1 Tax=Paracoccus pacificus TaxID=1463598 RepID=A0ABW4RB90_9RHOB
MGPIVPLVVLVVAGIALAHAARAFGRGLARRRHGRRIMLDGVAGDLADPRRLIAADGWPRISGRWRGAVFDLQLHPDALEVRKLPSLWLEVALIRQAARPRLTISRRRIGPARDLPLPVETPGAFPEDARISTDDPAARLPDPQPLNAAFAGLGDRLREVELTPSGIRLTWLLAEADRGRYLLGRDAEFPVDPVPADLAARLFDAALALDRALTAPPGERIAA